MKADSISKVILFGVIIIAFLCVVGVRCYLALPRVIEGRVVLLEHKLWPFDHTIITFTTLGGEDNIKLGGSWDIEIGAIYRIEYFTPFGYFYAVPLSIACTGARW